MQDTEYHLACLAAAVTVSSPALFADYFSWAKMVLAAHGVEPEDLQCNFDSFRRILLDNLQDGMSESLTPYLDSAAQKLAEPPSAPPSFLEGEDALSDLARRYLNALLQTNLFEAVNSFLPL